MYRFTAVFMAMALLLPFLLPEGEGRQESGAADSIPVLTDTVLDQPAFPASLAEAVWQDFPIADSLLSRNDRCLAQAVYFEARSEPLEGQLAVAQVVLNRVGNPRYPGNVCRVVFQNETWRHRCQFSFACDGLSDRPREPYAWEVAKRVSMVAKYGFWYDVSGSATHYHAEYVQPHWREDMQPTRRHGRHLFYREDIM